MEHTRTRGLPLSGLQRSLRVWTIAVTVLSSCTIRCWASNWNSLASKQRIPEFLVSFVTKMDKKSVLGTALFSSTSTLHDRSSSKRSPNSGINRCWKEWFPRIIDDQDGWSIATLTDREDIPAEYLEQLKNTVKKWLKAVAEATEGTRWWEIRGRNRNENWESWYP